MVEEEEEEVHEESILGGVLDSSAGSGHRRAAERSVGEGSVKM